MNEPLRELSFPIIFVGPNGRFNFGYVDPTDSAASVAIGAGMVATLVSFAGALPTAVWLMKRRQLGILETLWWGLAFGAVTYLMTGAANAGTFGPLGFVAGTAFASLLGVSGAAVFWLVAIRTSSRTG